MRFLAIYTSTELKREYWHYYQYFSMKRNQALDLMMPIAVTGCNLKVKYERVA